MFADKLVIVGTALCRRWQSSCITPVVGAFRLASCYEGDEARGKGLARYFQQCVPNLPLRGARVDDQTRQCENDTGNETRLSGPPPPSGGPFFIREPFSLPARLLPSEPLHSAWLAMRR